MVAVVTQMCIAGHRIDTKDTVWECKQGDIFTTTVPLSEKTNSHCIFRLLGSSA